MRILGLPRGFWDPQMGFWGPHPLIRVLPVGILPPRYQTSSLTVLAPPRTVDHPQSPNWFLLVCHSRDRRFLSLSFARFRAVLAQTPPRTRPVLAVPPRFRGGRAPSASWNPKFSGKNHKPAVGIDRKRRLLHQNGGLVGGANGGGVLGQKGAKNGIFGFEADFFSSFNFFS